ncbi:MAG: chitinase [Alteromonadaceae bacterium]|jgi:chitinase
MQYRLLFFMLILLGCSENTSTSADIVKGELTCKPIIVVYPIWKHSTEELANLPWNEFTHIVIAAIYPKDNGDILSEQADQFIDALVTLAHSKNKKVIISVGGAGNASKGFIALSKTQQGINDFTDNLLAYVKQHNLDGIDIDWEFWSYQHIHAKGGNDPIESQQLVNLLKTIRKNISDDTLLTTDISPGYWLGEQYLAELQDYSDYINLMAFDFTGAWSESPIGYHSDYETFVKSIELVLAKGFKKNKLLVGLPAYGIEFEDGKNLAIKHHAYRDIVTLLDNNAGELEKEKFKNIYFETPKSMLKKTQYVQDNSLAGVFLFEVTSDHKSEQHSLLTAINSVIRPKRCQ